VKAALSEGLLSKERWKSYLKLNNEVRRGLRRQDKILAAQDRKAWKKKSTEASNRKHSRRGNLE
jgi:ribosome biogenesis GTPase